MSKFARTSLLMIVSAMLAFTVSGTVGPRAALAQKKDTKDTRDKFDGIPIEGYKLCKTPAAPTRCEKKPKEIKETKKLICWEESDDCGKEKKTGTCLPFVKKEADKTKEKEWVKVTNESGGKPGWIPEKGKEKEYACICVQ